eukprot:4468229-Pyramimonas_sp.AAC.1
MPTVSSTLASHVIWVLSSHVGAVNTRPSYSFRYLPQPEGSQNVIRFVSSFVSTVNICTIIMSMFTVSSTLASHVIWVLSSHVGTYSKHAADLQGARKYI